MDVRNLVGVLEIAQRVGVKQQTVAMWIYRHKDFPEPVTHISRMPAFDWTDVEAWLKATGRRTRD